MGRGAAWQRAELYQLMLPAAKGHLQAAQDRDKRQHASRTHDSSGVPWQRHPYQEGSFVYLTAPTQEHTGDGQGATYLAGTQDASRSGGVELRGALTVCSASRSTPGTWPVLPLAGGPLPKYLQQRRGSSFKEGERRGDGPTGEACKGLGVLLNQATPLPLHQQGAVGNGQQGLWRLARAMESCWRHSSEHPWVHPGRTQG